jgi:hypothetical protein
MKCFCGKEMAESKVDVEVQECCAGGNYGTSIKEQNGVSCECGLSMAPGHCVWRGKTYPKWKYGSDDIIKIMGIEK